MPKITKVTYRRVFNLGNYQSEHIELEAEVEEGEFYVSVFKGLKSAVEELGTKL